MKLDTYHDIAVNMKKMAYVDLMEIARFLDDVQYWNIQSRSKFDENYQTRQGIKNRAKKLYEKISTKELER